MKKTQYLIKLLFLAALLGVLLCGCAVLDGVGETTETTAPTESAPQENLAAVERIALVVDADSIAQLEQYPSLRYADLTGSTCYAEIEDYCRRHPAVEVVYTVTIGSTAYPHDVQELTFAEGTYDTVELMEKLPHLSQLKLLDFPQEDLPREVLQQIRAVLPNLEIRYSVNIAGMIVDGNTQRLDLTMMDGAMVPAIAEKLPMLPRLQYVELLDGAGRSLLNLGDVQMLQAAAPKTVFHFNFTLFGRPVSTTDEEIVFTNENLASLPGAEMELRGALSVLRGCRRLVLDSCGFDNELLAQIRDEFRPYTKLVWRVWFAKDGSCLTDREMIRSTFNLTDNNCHDLMYCEDVKYFDMGHNESLSTVEFAAYMPNLVAVIVSGAPIRDLTPFANCPKLEFLEIAFCGYVKDISPLATCYSLERLNIGFTKVSDLSALDDKNMVCLVDTNTAVSNAERIRFEKLHPDCMVQHSGAQPYGHPWRYLWDKLTFNEYYEMLREVFDYENGTNTHF